MILPMERVIIALIALTSILAVAACGGSTEAEPASTSAPLPTATPAPTPTPQPTIAVSLGQEVAACLENALDADLARAVASGAIPLTAAQEAMLGNCVLSTSLGGSSATLSASAVACLEGALVAESAPVVAFGSASLTDEQQAVLGSCLLGSALGGTDSSGVSSGVLACLAEELGAEVAQVVASAVPTLNAEEEQILGNCVLKGALGLLP